MKKYKKDIIVLILMLFISIMLGLFVVNTLFFDFMTYHYHNGWAFWHNRYDIDFLPGLFRTYFNPFLDAVSYFLLERLNNNQALFSAIVSLQYGFLMFFAYKLYDYLFKDNGKDKIFSQLFCLILAGTSPIIILCNSFDKNDMFGAVMVLASIVLFLPYLFKEDSKKRDWIFFLSLLISGMAVGLKYTNMPYVAGMFLSIIFMCRKIQNPIKILSLMFLGSVVGFLITDGYWLYFLWTKFQNPFYPYFNEIFKSPLANVDSVLANDYSHLKPNSFLEFVLAPFKSLIMGGSVGLEIMYNDLKIPLGFFVMFLIFCTSKVKKFHARSLQYIDMDNIYFLLLLTVFSFYINLALLGNIRYMIILFIFIPVFIYVFVRNMLNDKLYKWVLLFLFIVILSTYELSQIYSKRHIPNSVKVVSIEDMNIEDNSTVLCSTFFTSFIIPNQNPNAKYIGFVLPDDLIEQGFFLRKNRKAKNRYYSNEYLEKILPDVISESDSLYIITSSYMYGKLDADWPLYEEALKRYSKGKISKMNNCKPIKYYILGFDNIYGKLKICKLK